MGQRHCCSAPWFLVSWIITTLAGSINADGALECSDLRPSQPQKLRLTAFPNSSSVGALWDSPANQACVDHFIVLVRPASGAHKEASRHKVRSRSVIVSNLKPNTTYRVDVVPVSRKHGTGPFATATVTTQHGPSCRPTSLKPGKPLQSQVMPSSSKSDKVTVTWAPPTSTRTACILGYRVEGFDASTGARVVSISLASDVQQVTVINLLPGTTYNFVIVARSGAGDSDPATIQVTTKSKAPMRPPAAAAAAEEAHSPLQPLAAAPRPMAPTQPAPARPLPPAPALAPALAPVPSATTDSPAEDEFMQPAAAVPAASTTSCSADVEPAAPKFFMARPLGKDKINLTWQDGDPAICTVSYKLDAYQLKTGDRVVGTKTGLNSYTLSQLAPGVEYAFTVAAVNSKGDSIPATTMASTPRGKR